MGWLAFAPIPGPTTDYFGISTNQVDLFSVIFMLVGIPVGFVAIWCADIIGIIGLYSSGGSQKSLETSVIKG
jgi:MFS transporter, FLVCR family, MFS-domain-containing protein 7